MKRTAILYAPTADEAAVAGGAGRTVFAGVEVVEAVAGGDDAARSGLAGALELIAGGAAGVLVVARLRDAASSMGELVALLEWLEQAGADLIAADVGFDSGEASARGTVALLREVGRWDRDPDPGGRLWATGACAGRLPAGRRCLRCVQPAHGRGRRPVPAVLRRARPATPSTPGRAPMTRAIARRDPRRFLSSLTMSNEHD